jgi:hypothetical protein
MNDPRRLIDESQSDFERALLRTGRSYRAAPELRTKTLSALGLAGTTAMTAAAAGASSLTAAPSVLGSAPSFLAKAGWIKLVGGCLVVGTAAAIPVGYALSIREPSDARVAAAVSPNVETSASAPGAAPPAVEQPELPRVEAAPLQDLAKIDNPAPKLAASNAALGDELEALDAARAALASGNPQRALSLLDQYDRANPRGRLKLESEVLRIDALARSGRGDQARSRAEKFLARHPNSVLASRVRSYTQP